MSTSSSIIIDGVEFKLSESLKLRQKIALPSNVVLQDINSLLEECNYDFSAEKNLLLAYQRKQKEIEEHEIRQKKKKIKENHKENSQQPENMKEDENESSKDKESSDGEEKMSTSINNFSASNPFLNDIFGNSILTPQKYTNVDKDVSDQRRSLDVGEFVNENQDPFSNAELETIDDLKELKDVLKNVTMGEMVQALKPPKPSPRVRRHSLTDKNEEVNIKITKIQENDDNAGENSRPITALRSSPILRESPDNLSPIGVSRVPPTSNDNSFPSVMSVGGIEPLGDRCASLPEPSVSNNPSPIVQNHISSRSKDGIKKSDSAPSSNNERKSPIFDINPISATSCSSPDESLTMEIVDNSYVNVQFVNKPKVSPKPASKPRVNAVETNPSVNHEKTHQTFASVSASSHVQSKVLANKSIADRAKFEATINKALTSLPTFPKTVVTSKAAPSAPDSSILSGLSATERNCVEPIVAMGYGEKAVLRAMRKCGHENRNEILDCLFKRQSLNEKGFPADRIEEAMDLFQEDTEEAQKYLDLEQKFLNMGFPNLKVKEALLLHNNDQAKALEDLMPGS